MARKNVKSPLAPVAIKNEGTALAVAPEAPKAPTIAPANENEEKALVALSKLAALGWDGFGRGDVFAVMGAIPGMTPAGAALATDTLRAPYSKNGRALPKSQGEPIFSALVTSGEWLTRGLAAIRSGMAPVAAK